MSAFNIGGKILSKVMQQSLMIIIGSISKRVFLNTRNYNK